MMKFSCDHRLQRRITMFCKAWFKLHRVTVQRNTAREYLLLETCFWGKRSGWCYRKQFENCQVKKTQSTSVNMEVHVCIPANSINNSHRDHPTDVCFRCAFVFYCSRGVSLSWHVMAQLWNKRSATLWSLNQLHCSCKGADQATGSEGYLQRGAYLPMATQNVKRKSKNNQNLLHLALALHNI